ncbi:hypothetical protein ACHQM5_018361 [Ranunculus cassubicifolius]
MAKLLSPVSTTDSLLKFQTSSSSSSSSFCSNNQWRILAKTTTSSNLCPTTRGSGKRGGRIKAVAEESSSFDGVADDYYAVLGLLPDATPEQIKKAYYSCMKSCHPDFNENDPEINNFCMFINEIYEVLSDPVQRMVYDDIHGYSLTATNPFLDDSSTKDHAFVDEFSCIGCKNCANVAPTVFEIEEDFGRARVHCQSGYSDIVQQAIESCPVDCIHWTSAAQVSLLEDEMRRVERVNVALMLAGMGTSADVFRMASSRWEKRQSKVLETARVRMMKQKGSNKPGSNWRDLWGSAKDYENTDEEKKERAKRAAAAARRWREYSRKGTDRPPVFKLPESVSNKD